MYRVAPIVIALGCSSVEPRALPRNVSPAPPDQLCAVLDEVIAAGRDNFAGLVDAERDTHPTMVPAGAEASYRPCCASASAESGPWTWAAEWPHTGRADLDRFRARVLGCDFAPELVVLSRTPTAITWELAGDHVTLALTATARDLELDVMYHR
jgi:hypothetical protein